jgi:hypothetical protein
MARRLLDWEERGVASIRCSHERHIKHFPPRGHCSLEQSLHNPSLHGYHVQAQRSTDCVPLQRFIPLERGCFSAVLAIYLRSKRGLLPRQLRP